MSLYLIDYHEDAEGRFAALLQHKGGFSYHLYVPHLEIDARAFTRAALRLQLAPHIKTPPQIDGLLSRAAQGQPEATRLLENHRNARAASRLLKQLAEPEHSDA